MFGGVFFRSADEGKHYKNCGCGVRGDMRVGSASALASGVFGEHSSDISGQCDFRYYFCMVGFSALCSGQFDWMAMDAGDYQAYQLSIANRLRCSGFTEKMYLVKRIAYIVYRSSRFEIRNTRLEVSLDEADVDFYLNKKVKRLEISLPNLRFQRSSLLP